MANKKISELELLVHPTLADVLPIVNENVTKKIPVGTLLQSGLPISASSIIATTIHVEGNITANSFTIISSSIIYATGSTNFGDSSDDNHNLTGSVYITGSLNVIGGINGVINATNGVISSSAQITAYGFISSSQTIDTASFAITGSNLFRGDQTISGSLFVSGTTEFGGNLVPKEARGATLGTELRPFSEIFVSSGSINIASDIIGDPNTTLTNVGGNILVSAGGMRLVGDASFIAATGSFSYISGSMTQEGDYTQTGDYTMIGNKTITGSLNITGSGYINSKKILTDLVTSSLATTGSNTFRGDQTITGSLYVSASLNINNGFYVDGNKQFNYGLFSDLTTQSGSANTAYPMKLNTTDIAEGFSIVSGSRITAANTGTYNLQFSAQLLQTTNNSPEVSIWLRKGGTNVPNSNTELTIEKVAGGGTLVAAWNYIVQLNTNQYVELMWSSTRSDTELHYHDVQSTPTRPATPSVIVTMTQVA